MQKWLKTLKYNDFLIVVSIFVSTYDVPRMNVHALVDLFLFLLHDVSIHVSNHIEGGVPHIRDDVFFRDALADHHRGVIMAEVMEPARNTETLFQPLVSARHRVWRDADNRRSQRAATLKLGQNGRRNGKSSISCQRLGALGGIASMVRWDDGLVDCDGRRAILVNVQVCPFERTNL